jgi:carboxyl-terminal processing protease
MKRMMAFIPILFIVLGTFLSACNLLVPLKEIPVTGEFGPAYSAEEHQTRTFEALWKNIEDSYVYYDTARVDWQTLHDQYQARIDSGLSDEQFAALLQDLEKELPDGSIIYQSRAERLQSDMTDSSTYGGIGAFIGFQPNAKPHIVILDVISGSPAEQAGLRAHDSIFSIDGSPVLLEEGLGASDRIRGPAGSSVTLNVKTPGKPERSVKVKRAEVSSAGKLGVYNITGSNYGYLLFPPLGYEGLDQDVVKGLQSLATNRKLEGLVLDLRIVNSSADWPIDSLLTIFENGAIGEIYDRKGNQPLEIEGQDLVGSQSMPLTILVGQNTKGFAEIFAASLQGSKRAVIVGEPTPGEVETQSAFYLPDGSRMFLQSSSFRLTNGDELGTSGIKPDVVVPAGWDQVLPDQDPVLERAVQIIGMMP